MKKLMGLLLSLSLVLWGCNNSDNRTSAINQGDSSKPSQETGKLNDYLKKYEEPSQTFNVNSSKPTQIKGKKGTVISLNPADLETVGGQPVGKNIQIELKELTNKQQLLRTNAQTVSNGQLLVSGGAYYINMTSNGQQLKLKEGRYLKVIFPRLTDKEMALFYGQRDSIGQINWQKANETFAVKQEKKQSDSVVANKTTNNKSDIDVAIEYIVSSDTTDTPEKKTKRQKNYKVAQKVYEALNIKSFGWINCDRFLYENDKTELLVKFNPSDSIMYANIYLVFKDINSVMQEYYYSPTANSNSVKFEDIPVGYKTRLIAFTVKDEKAYAFSSDVTISKNQKLDIALKPVTEQEFKNLVGR